MAARTTRSFSVLGLLVRVVFSIALVLVTYNPTQYSYVDWALNHAEGSLPLVVLAGVVLLILYAIYIRSTVRAMGTLGIILAAAFLAALLWVLVDAGVLSLSGDDALQWVILLGIGIILGIGLSWSHVRRILSGQVDVDDVEN
jgi:Na+/melibiose symporter-like transporter